MHRRRDGDRYRSRYDSRGESYEYRNNSLNIIKSLKSWGLRYSGEDKESPEQFLSRLNACKQATGIQDDQLLPCPASMLMKDAGDWYEVYQDDMELWDFATFEKTFRRQFIDSFEAIERYDREFERREAIKERYHSPPRRENREFRGRRMQGHIVAHIKWRRRRNLRVEVTVANQKKGKRGPRGSSSVK